jgi:hypothetical protein
MATGNLYRATSELLHIELGSIQPLMSLPYEKFNIFTAKSIAKHIWKFLSEENTHLATDINMLQPRKGDCESMP